MSNVGEEDNSNLLVDHTAEKDDKSAQMAMSQETEKGKEVTGNIYSLQHSTLESDKVKSTPAEEEEPKEEEESESTSRFGTGCLSWMFLPKDRKVKTVASDIKSLGKTTKIEKKLLK